MVSCGMPAFAARPRWVKPARWRASRTIRPAIDISTSLLITYTSSRGESWRVKRRGATGLGSTILRAMPVLRSRLDPASAETRANHDAMAGTREDLRARQAAVAARGAGGDDRSIERHRERGKLPVRERIDRLLDPGSAFLELSPLAATGLYDDDAPGRRHRHRDRPDRGHHVRGRRQRRDRQGRHLLPDDGQEAPPRPGDRAREPAALRLPRRQRRRVPPAPGRGLPRPRPLRSHLLQPGADVGRRDPAGRAGDGLVHGRRRVRPGDERRDRHRPRHGHDLPRRSAAREGRHRRGRHARGARWGGGPHPPVGRRGPRGARRRARARARPLDRREPEPRAARRRRGTGATPSHRPSTRPATTRRLPVRRRLGRPAAPRPGPGADRPARRRLAVPRVQAALRRDPGHGLRPRRRATRSRSSPTTASCSASRRSRARISSSWRASAGSRSSSCRTSPGSWSAASTRRRASPRTARSS